MTFLELHQTTANYLNAGQFKEAIFCCEEALKEQPDCVPFLNLRGLASRGLGQWQSALELHQRALLLEADNVESLNYIGEIYLTSLHLTDAAAYFLQAIHKAPDYSVAWSNLGYTQSQLKRHTEAVASLKKAVQLEPNNADFLNRLGIAFRGAKQLEKAIEAYQKALHINPGSAQIWNNIGAALQYSNNINDAQIAYQKAITLHPNYASAWNNLGACFQAQHQLDNAIQAYQKAQIIDPKYFQAAFHEGQARLLGGDFEQGWPKHEYRWLTIQSDPQRQFAQPLWQGTEALFGKTIILHSEQGFGDTIQFIRYATVLSDMGAIVYLEVQAQLKEIAASVPGVQSVYPFGSTLPVCDFHCPLMTLPLRLRTTMDTIPRNIPYLTAAPEIYSKWSTYFTHTHRQKIGIVWRGNPEHENDENRSLPFGIIRSLLELPLYEFINLQFDRTESEAEVFNTSSTRQDPTPLISDYNDTAAIISQLDLVITVDTSVAHLAGALGKPVWILLPYSPDWRWMLTRKDSPWYPSARLFRQPSPRDWACVIEEITGELSRLAPPVAP